MNIITENKKTKGIEIITIADASNTLQTIEKLKLLGIKFVYNIVVDIDNLFFDAYEFDQNVGATLNISKAKNILLDCYRKARTPLLDALDVDFMRAVESGNINLQKEIAAKKQALRDVTKTELPDTLKGIKAGWPEILGKNPFE